MASAVDLEVAREELKPQLGAHPFSAAEGVGGAASAWVADESNRVLGQELSPEEAGQHAELVQAAKTEELDAWKKFDVFDSR